MTPLTLLLAADQKSQQVTDWSSRIGWIVGLALLVALVYWLMREGWKWRGTLQGGLPELPAAPEDAPGDGGEPPLTLKGRYHGSTTAGQWLDRIVAHGLGVRSMAELTLTAQGLRVERKGAPDFFVPAAALRGARLDKGIAGKVLTEGGLLVITWEHGGTLIDSGFRSEHAAEHTAWVEAITAASSAAPAPAGSAAPASGAAVPVPDQHPGDSVVADRLHQEGPR
ncbi:hypothetical protein QMK19_13670 [Streptomyces sp. H10-C2]|uniref:PH-like domain-containing protein n=1 Tax=unclassified Streptomyces TaxID=2593676 RepID=UPI0024B97D19|nr:MULTISPECIES: hypothetical protein [unclassified Streptomyces]MDJ0345253.1 hypothetical protein [Streptomyces sp. PH10-H1]MDJ0370704.1 hypothetical protein [Streptomyces sp. H10-C2]